MLIWRITSWVPARSDRTNCYGYHQSGVATLNSLIIEMETRYDLLKKLLKPEISLNTMRSL
ncbi:MAG: hypothetical protein R2778_06890 [Saprospiraceae bacterium]